MQYMTTVFKLGEIRTLSLISSPSIYLGLSWDDLYSLYGWCAHIEVLETSSFETAIMFAGAARGADSGSGSGSGSRLEGRQSAKLARAPTLAGEAAPPPPRTVESELQSNLLKSMLGTMYV